MTVFGMDDRGKFRSVGVDTSDGKGIQVSIAGESPIGNSTIVTSFGAQQAENYAVSQCLNGGIFLYTFGHDPARSQFSLDVTTFLNSCRDGSGEGLATALKTYQAGRVSKSKTLSSLTVGNGSMTGYLIGQDIEVSDAELSMITTSYTFIALSAHGEGT